ncbi:MAG: hypothetical protein HZB41_05130 [Ignavibacteriae bacterium]|nr:hypothetical protein [Ignavibacteriota bacterium]
MVKKGKIFKPLFNKIYNSWITKLFFLLSTTFSIFSFIDNPPTFIFNIFRGEKLNLTGDWKLINIVENSNKSRFNNFHFTFYMTMLQKGNILEGEAEKVKENNKNIIGANRIHLDLKGRMVNDSVIITFNEKGKIRETIGTMYLKIKNNGYKLKGFFISTAADSKGSSVAERFDYLSK